MANKETLKNKVGIGGLIALIIGGTIGSGIFALPSTMTKGANPEGILIGWAIVAVGMFALAGVYRNLTLQQPDIDDGIYGWAKGMFGVTLVASLQTTVMESETLLEIPAILLLFSLH